MRGIVALGLALLVVLVIGASSAWSAAPTLLKVEVIGGGNVTSTKGLNCGLGQVSCTASFVDTSATDTLTASPTSGSGWVFSHWEDGTGTCTGAANPCTTGAMGADTTVTAVFTTSGAVSTGSYGVSLSGFGTVTSNSTNYNINCSQHPTGSPLPTGANCSLTLPLLSTFTVVEKPDDGNLFNGWGGSCVGKTLTCTVFFNGSDRSVAASFTPSSTTYPLTVTVDSGGSVDGSVVCGGGTSCSFTEPAGAMITIAAHAQSGFAFTGWSGACTGLQLTCTIQMDAGKSVMANFAPLVPVSVTVTGNGQVSLAGTTCAGPGPTTCTVNVPPNTSQVLTATPSTPSGGVTWNGCTSVSGTECRISVSSSPVSVTATFTGGPPPPSNFQLSINVGGNGTVTSSSGSIYCTAGDGAGCAAQLPQNTTVTLTAVPASGATADFVSWSGDCSAFTATTCTLTMTGAKSVGALFTGSDTTYTLTGQVTGTGSGSITGAGLNCSSSGGTGCSSPQAASATVTIVATAGPGSTFTGWGGACSGTTTTCRVAMTAAKNVTATFATSGGRSGPELTLTVSGGGTVKSSAGVCTSVPKQTRICTQDFAADAKVTLTATPASGQGFFGWKGACTGGVPTCTVTMSKSTAVSATFAVPTLLAPHAPRSRKVTGGYLVTTAYTVREIGTLKYVVGKASRSRKVRISKSSFSIRVAKHGKYTVSLTFTSKTGVQTLSWTIRV